MALSIGIYRHRSQKPFQKAIRQKFVVPTKVIRAEQPGVYAKANRDRAYAYYLRKRIPPEVRWQLFRAKAPITTLGQEAPGYLAAVQKNRRQLGIERIESDVYWKQEKQIPFGVAAAVQEPGYLAAIKKLRLQLNREPTEFEVRWQLQRTFPFRAPTVTLGQQDTGYLAAIYKRRLEMQHLVHRDVFDVRWQLHRPFPYRAPPVTLGQQEPGHLAAIRSLRKQLGRKAPRYNYEQPRRVGRRVKHARFHDIGYLAAIRQQRKQLGREVKFVDIRWQLNRTFPLRAPPVILGEPAPGWLEGIYKRRVLYPRLLEREVFDVRWQLHRVFPFKAPVTFGGVTVPGFLGAIEQQRKQLGREREVFDVRQQLRQRQVVSGVFVPPSVPTDIGWLVSWMTKRAYGHNLRR